MIINIFEGWTRTEILALIGIFVSILIAFAIYLLQKRLTDKQRVDNRLAIEDVVTEKLYGIKYKNESRDVQLYNSKLINKKYFASNKRSRIWGLPYHAAYLYDQNFDGLEFAVSIEEWDNVKYDKVGVIPYENILGIKPEGDSSFSGVIFYVKPKLLQIDKYSISYKSFRYYKMKDGDGRSSEKPFKKKVVDNIKKVGLTIRYNFYTRWKNYLRNMKSK